MDFISLIRNELVVEADAIRQAADRIDSSVNQAIEIIRQCSGKVVCTGMGKMGIIARKLSATMASTGTSSIFLHAAEGIHGDLGILDRGDVLVAFSYSGMTQEVVSLIPYLKFMQIPIIAITGNAVSELASNADVILDCAVPPESEPFGLVPTASTTVALALGDALAIALMKMRGFSKQDFARFHPGGTIGKKILLRVQDIMHKDADIPCIREDQGMSEAICEMTVKRLGCTCVVDQTGILTGFLTDGDLRRLLQKEGCDPLHTSVTDAMTKNPKRLQPDKLAIDAINLMEQFNITMLPITDQHDHPVGVLHMHDLIKAGVVG